MYFRVGNTSGGDASWWLYGDNNEMVAWAGETFASQSDSKRGASKWRWPTGDYKPARLDQADRLQPLIPRETSRFTALYRGRAAGEREFGRLKNEWALSPRRVRGLDRVRLDAELTILAKLAKARDVPLAA